jgi:WhiB family redox-sensing transcriptional regulator
MADKSAPACEGAPNPEIWFPERGHPDAKDHEAEAKALCWRCDYRPACLQFALVTRQTVGIWGGLNHIQRGRILARVWRQHLADMAAAEGTQ